jgi:hypothetical protein
VHLQYVGLAANLTVFDVALVASGGFVHRGGIPFAAAGALKSSLHIVIIFDLAIWALGFSAKAGASSAGERTGREVYISEQRMRWRSI